MIITVIIILLVVLIIILLVVLITKSLPCLKKLSIGISIKDSLSVAKAHWHDVIHTNGTSCLVNLIKGTAV